MYQPYSSIDNFRPKNVEGFLGKNVVFTEKIHGSNLQFYVDIDENNTISIGQEKGNANLPIFISKEKFILFFCFF